MIRSIMFLVLITAVAGFLTLGCKQDSGKDAKVDSEKSATTAETPGDKDTGSEENKVATAPERREVDPEARLKNMQKRRKKIIDQSISIGIFTKIDTSGSTVNAYVGDKYHDLKKRQKKNSVRILYMYYTNENPDIKTVNVYDEQTGKQIVEVSSEGYKKITN